MNWPQIFDWLLANWLGLLTLAVVGFGTAISWLHYRRSKRDVTPRVFFVDADNGDQHKIKVEQHGDAAGPLTVDLVVVNVGGSKLKRGKITVTSSYGLQPVDSPCWTEDTPNALLRGASAVSHGLPTIGRNDRVRLPPLTLHEPSLRLAGSSHHKSYKLRWKVWKGGEGLGSDDLKINYRLTPAPE